MSSRQGCCEYCCAGLIDQRGRYNGSGSGGYRQHSKRDSGDGSEGLEEQHGVLSKELVHEDGEERMTRCTVLLEDCLRIVSNIELKVRPFIPKIECDVIALIGDRGLSARNPTATPDRGKPC